MAASAEPIALEHVILVDRNGRELATREKLAAHRDGALHRAVSVFLFTPGDGSLIVQRRAAGKYHSGGLWSNTACTHPRPGESVAEAARRCLRTEMGITDCTLREAFAFTYRADVGNDLVEHEFDHVFVGWYDGTPAPAPDEVSEWRRLSARHLEHELRVSPAAFTPWLRLAWRELWKQGVSTPPSAPPIARGRASGRRS